MTEFHRVSNPDRKTFKTVAQRLLNGAAALACGATLAAAPASADGLTKISRASPFANCTADKVGSQVGTNYPDSEIEPWLAVNPLFRGNLIAGWQQDRWSNGGSRGLVAGVSLNGGQTWATIVPPRVTLCTGGPWQRASDPWVTISPSGKAFFMHLAFMEDRPDGGFGKNAMLVSRSTSWGFSWSNPITLIEDTNGQILNDKNSMTADPQDSRFVYATWDRLQDFTLPEAAAAAAPAGKAAVRTNRTGDGLALARERLKKLKTKAAGRKAKGAAPAAVPVLFIGPTYFARTTNGGNSWEKAKLIYDPGGNAQTINNLLEVLKDGTLADFFTNIVCEDPIVGPCFADIGLIKSHDKGASFGPANLAIPIDPIGVVTPNDEKPVRDASILFDVATDRRNGNLYLVWQDARFAGIDQVAFSMSTDGGETWSDPVRIDMTPPSANPLRNQAFVPSVEVGRDHEIVVTYYDFRNDTDAAGKELTDYFAVFCTPSFTTNCAKRESWGDGVAKGKDIRITETSFNMLDAPVARGHFLGDYMGLARKGRDVMPAFGIADGLNKVSVYTKPIRSRKVVVSQGN
jgi:hypothetical protein